MKAWLLFAIAGLWTAHPAWAELGQVQRIAFCGSYVREGGFCGSTIPQTTLLIKESIALDSFGSPIYYRTPYGIFDNYGPVKAVMPITPLAGLTRTLWFEDSQGDIRNVPIDINYKVPDMYIRRKGTAVAQ